MTIHGVQAAYALHRVTLGVEAGVVTGLETGV